MVLCGDSMVHLTIWLLGHYKFGCVCGGRLIPYNGLGLCCTSLVTDFVWFVMATVDARDVFDSVIRLIDLLLMMLLMVLLQL